MIGVRPHPTGQRPIIVILEDEKFRWVEILDGSGAGSEISHVPAGKSKFVFMGRQVMSLNKGKNA